jgi:hypothetical protein
MTLRTKLTAIGAAVVLTACTAALEPPVADAPTEGPAAIGRHWPARPRPRPRSSSPIAGCPAHRSWRAEEGPSVRRSGSSGGVVVTYCAMAARIGAARFVGRVEELARLTDVLRSAGEGEPATVLVGGDAGVGKTRLIGEFSAVRESRARWC